MRGSWLVARGWWPALGLLLAAACAAQDAVPLPEPGDFIQFEADALRVEADNRVTARGNVRAKFRDLTLASERAETNAAGTEATFQGSVALTTAGASVRGEYLRLDLVAREWKLGNARSDLTQEFLKGNAEAPIYVRGASLAGTEEEVIAAMGSVTTCDRPRPHYLLSAREILVFPRERIVARGVSFDVLGRTAAKLASVNIPLNRVGDRSVLLPQVGQTVEEGSYLKLGYNYAASKTNSGLFKLDLMSRKGIGQGLEHNWRYGEARGLASVYRLQDRNLGETTTLGRLSHAQKIGGVSTDLLLDYRGHSYQFAPETTSLRSELNLSRSGSRTSTTMSVRDDVITGSGNFSTFDTSLEHDVRLNGKSRVGLRAEYSRFAFPGQPTADSVLESRVDYRHSGSRYDWGLVANDQSVLTGQSRFAGIERLPELSFQTDSYRFANRKVFGTPARLSFAAGRYREEPTNVETERAVLELRSNTRRRTLGRGLRMDAELGFRQAFYGDNTAQYVLQADTDVTRSLGGESALRLSYRFWQPRGFSPFRFDFVGDYNLLQFGLDVRRGERFRLSVMGGRDFTQKLYKYQDLSLHAVYSPTERLYLYTSTAYDVNRSRWRPVTNQLRIRGSRGLRLDLGTRYDVRQGQLDLARGQVDLPIGGKWRVQALAGWNGYRNDFDYRSVMVTRDLHCWDASLLWVDREGSYAERGVRLILRLKAFPVYDQFGVGQFGEMLDTGVGEGM